ncbi:hypothetical protein PVAP13_9NG817831 [Panicum virgatum]|uniref:Uncharacterized protein n=1 Tax=Panicum virgatum TaxID=38727 RepID=A0A8T0N137_PANVG|nr:hypothetical protein PVAP13_9NG817831 [Panicum virgatum]
MLCQMGPWRGDAGRGRAAAPCRFPRRPAWRARPAAPTALPPSTLPVFLPPPRALPCCLRPFPSVSFFLARPSLRQLPLLLHLKVQGRGRPGRLSDRSGLPRLAGGRRINHRTGRPREHAAAGAVPVSGCLLRRTGSPIGNHWANRNNVSFHLLSRQRFGQVR